MYKVATADLSVTVAVSGTVEPVTYTTVRPDSNLPTRKLVRLLVKEGDTVRPGQAVAEVDASGLDLDYASAKASYESAKVKLVNLKAGATATELAQAESSLLSAKLDLQTQQANYDSTKALVDKGLAAKGELDAAERQLSLAKLKLEAATSSYNDVKAGSAADVIQAQEAAVAQASNSLQKAKLILESATVRTPVAGLVTDIPVAVGDLVGPEHGPHDRRRHGHHDPAGRGERERHRPGEDRADGRGDPVELPGPADSPAGSWPWTRRPRSRATSPRSTCRSRCRTATPGCCGA